MIKTTKKMREDIRKLNEDDLVVYDVCASEEIWAKINSCIVIDGEPYYKYANEVDDEQYWCEGCNDMARPQHITEYKEKK